MGMMKDYSKELEKLPPTGADLTFKDAIGVYEATGGLVKFDGGKSAKHLVYPTEKSLSAQLGEATKRTAYLGDQIKYWENTHRRNVANPILEKAKSFTDPLLWEHQYKMMVDKAYKDAFEIVDLPIERVKDKKYRRMIELFLHDAEYRERLIEARTSDLGKRREPMKAEADSRANFRANVIENRISKLKSEKKFFEIRQRALSILLNGDGAKSDQHQ